MRVIIDASYNEKLDNPDYENLVEVEGTANSIIKPRLDITGYIDSLTERWVSENISSSEIASLKSKLTKFYDENKEAYYKVEPKKLDDGSYDDTQFSIIYDKNNKVQDIYKRDAQGNLVYFDLNNSEYTVRVDYFYYF